MPLKERTSPNELKIFENIQALKNSGEKIDETVFNSTINSFSFVPDKRFYIRTILENDSGDLIEATTETHNAMLDKCYRFRWPEEAETLFGKLKLLSNPIFLIPF